MEPLPPLAAGDGSTHSNAGGAPTQSRELWTCALPALLPDREGWQQSETISLWLIAQHVAAAGLTAQEEIEVHRAFGYDGQRRGYDH